MSRTEHSVSQLRLEGYDPQPIDRSHSWASPMMVTWMFLSCPRPVAFAMPADRRSGDSASYRPESVEGGSFPSDRWPNGSRDTWPCPRPTESPLLTPDPSALGGPLHHRMEHGHSLSQPTGVVSAQPFRVTEPDPRGDLSVPLTHVRL